MLLELVRTNRSCRRFHQDHRVDADSLRQLVELARLSASAANLQPLKYIISCEAHTNREIFDCLTWAAYLKDWPGPAEGERPAAYIVILHDTAIAKEPGCDHGIAAQSILLGAREMGLAGCMLGAVDRGRLRQRLAIDGRYRILLVLAIGKPRERVVLDTVGEDGDIKYWRDADGVHHVPKRRLEELILATHD